MSKLSPTQQNLLDQLDADSIKNNPLLRCALALERIATAVERMVPAPMPVPLKKYTEEPH